MYRSHEILKGCAFWFSLVVAAAAPAVAQSADSATCRSDAFDISDASMACTPQPQTKTPDASAVRGRKHETGASIEELSRTLALDGDNLDALKARAHAYYDAYQYDRAIVDFSHAIRLSPNDSDMFDARGPAADPLLQPRHRRLQRSHSP